MPEIQITMKDRGVETRRSIARQITDIMVRETGLDPEWITIHFYDTDDERAARGGTLLRDRVSNADGMRLY